MGTSSPTTHPYDAYADEITTAEVAIILGVSRMTVRKYADRGLVPTSRVLPSGRRRFSRADVERVAAGLVTR